MAWLWVPTSMLDRFHVETFDTSVVFLPQRQASQFHRIELDDCARDDTSNFLCRTLLHKEQRCTRELDQFLGRCTLGSPRSDLMLCQ